MRLLIPRSVTLGCVFLLISCLGAQTKKPDWKIHQTMESTTDIVVAAYSILEYGAVADGKTDCTEAFEQALEDLDAIGGGTLFVPAGRYVIKGELEVPVSTTIRGEWADPESESGVKGTVLMAYAGRGEAEGTPFITVNICGGVKDLSIWYPEQDAENIVPYPFTLIQKGGDNATFENLTLVNSYQGIKIGPGGNELHYVHNVHGSPLKVGVWYDSTTDIGRLEQVHFSPDYWSRSGLPGAPETDGPHASWMLKNGTGLHMFRSDWEYVSYVRVAGYNIGFHMSEGVRGAANAQFYELNISGCKTALQVEKTNPIGMVFTKCNLLGQDYGVRVTNEFNSVVMFAMCSIEGRNSIVSEGTGSVILQQCKLRKGDVKTNGGAIALSSCEFLDDNSRIVLGKQVAGASLTGNIGNPQVINHASKGILKTSQEKVDFSPIPEFDANQKRQFKPARSFLYVATERRWGVKSGDKRDDSKALQQVLDYAAAKGGGIVFLPAGDYIIKGNLIVHPGVELRGIHDVPHHTMGGGSILHVIPQNDQPTILLMPKSGVRGLSFNYPEQNIQDVKEYPFLMQGWGEDIYVINVNAANPYKYLDLMSYRCDRHYVDYLSGGPLKVGINVGAGSQDGDIRNMQFNPHYWNRSPRDNPLFDNSPGGGIRAGTSGGLYWEYQKNNMDSLTVGHATNQFLFQNFVFGSLYGISFTEENGKGPVNCIVHGHGTDGSKVGLYFKSGKSTINMINSELVAMASENKIAIKLDKAFSGIAILINTMIWGHPDIMAEVNNGVLLIQSGSARHHGAGMKVNGGSADVVNFNFNQATVHVSLPVKGALSMIGCVTPDGMNVSGNKVAADVEDGKLSLQGNVSHGRGYDRSNRVVEPSHN